MYAPTAATEQSEHEDFYEQIEATLRKASNRSMTIIMGDFNAEVEEGQKVRKTS